LKDGYTHRFRRLRLIRAGIDRTCYDALRRRCILSRLSHGEDHARRTLLAGPRRALDIDTVARLPTGRLFATR